MIIFNPRTYSANFFWQTNETSEQKVYAIISNYLSTNEMYKELFGLNN